LNNADQISNYIKDLNFDGMVYGMSALESLDIFRYNLAINTLTKDVILSSKEEYSNSFTFYISQYDVDDIMKIFKQNKVKILSFTKTNSYQWLKRSEIQKVYDLYLYANLFNEPFQKYPEGWLDDRQLIEWLEKRKSKNIPKEIIAIKNNINLIVDRYGQEYSGEYKITNGKIDIYFKMRFESYCDINQDKGDRIIYEIDPILGHMIGWTVRRLLEYCTLNKLQVERVKILEYLPTELAPRAKSLFNK
jgi:hypothetical protein